MVGMMLTAGVAREREPYFSRRLCLRGPQCIRNLIPAALDVGSEQFIIDVDATIAKRLVEAVQDTPAASIRQVYFGVDDFLRGRARRARKRKAGVTDDE